MPEETAFLQNKEEQKRNSDPAFVVTNLDRDDGTIVLEIKKGIIGPLANQLKKTSYQRKGASIIRKLGFVLSESGDYLYDQNESQKPDFVTK